MTTTVLVPFHQETGFTDVGTGDVIEDAPVLVGGGSVADGSDATYAQLGGYVDSDGFRHAESIAADFFYDGVTPVALVLQVRLRTDDDVLLSPVTPALNDNPAILSTVDNVIIDTLDLRWAEVKEGLVGSPTWYTWAVQGDIENVPPVDLDDPTDAGGWFPIEPGDDAYTALTGDGLRFTFGAFWNGDDTNPDIRRAWIDLYEMRLIVATRSNTPMRRKYPNPTGQGVGPTRHWPRPRRGVGGIN